MDVRIVGPGHHFLHLEHILRDYYDMGILATTKSVEPKKKNAFFFDAGANAASKYIDLIDDIDYFNLYGCITHGHGDHFKGLEHMLNTREIKEIKLFGPRGHSFNAEAPPLGILHLVQNLLNTENRGKDDLKTKIDVVQIAEDNIQLKSGFFKLGKKYRSKKEEYKHEPSLEDIFQLENDTHFDITATLSPVRHGTSKDWVLSYSLTEKSLQPRFNNLRADDYGITKGQMKILSKTAKSLLRKIIKQQGSLINSKQQLVNLVEDELSRKEITQEREYNRMQSEYDAVQKNPNLFSEDEQERINKYKSKLEERKKLFTKKTEEDKTIVNIIANEEICYSQNKFTYITDTPYVQDGRFARLAKDSDILYCGATQIDGESSDHLRIRHALEIAQDSNSKKLLIGHLNRRSILGAVRYMKSHRKIYKPKFLGEYLPKLTKEDLCHPDVKKQHQAFMQLLDHDVKVYDFPVVMALPQMSFPINNPMKKIS